MAIASHSHSSPKGHVSKPSTYGMWVCRSEREPAAAHGRQTATKSSARSRSPAREAKSRAEIAGVKRS